MLRKLNLSLTFFYFLMGIAYTTSIPYIIYTVEDFQIPAQNMSVLHSQTIPQISNFESLETEIIYKENTPEDSFIQYLSTFDNSCYNSNNETDCLINQSCIWDDSNTCIETSKYLLIIGDETLINSILVPMCGDNQFSDDVYNTNFTIGRLVVNNLQEATNQVQKIINYTTDSMHGSWKNELLLIADDQNNPSNPNSITEINHTLNTSDIYLTLENKLLIRTLYGEEFPDQVELTENIINIINSGVGIINYIGHGTDQSLAHELILKMDRDINLINTNNKPPIWVIGTCSFGKYINNICMAEELMKKEDAAIAIISTTDGIPASGNNTYLSNFYNRVEKYIDGENYRLGDIFKKAKLQDQNNQCTPYKFQLFGDPALPLLLFQERLDLAEAPEEILIGSSNFIEINDEYEEISYIKIVAPNIVTPIQNTEYLKPGPILFESGSFIDTIFFYTPIDAIYDNAKLFIMNENTTSLDNNFIQVENNIPLNLDIDENILTDNEGPEITIHFNNIQLENNSTIYNPYNLKIYFSDNLPINLSGYNFHYLKLWIDNNYSSSIILNDYLFIPTSNTSGYIEVLLDQNIFIDNRHTINIEGWDILNNHSIASTEVNIDNSNQERIFNVFNFPNPFENKTFFTFQMMYPEPININIEVLSKAGKKLMTFKESINNSSDYHVFPVEGWNGRNFYGEKLKNGTYFYHLHITDNKENILHSKIHNITILN